MDLVELIEKIREIALEQKGVHSFTDGDIYDNLNSGEIKYGNVNVGLENVSYDGNMETYSFVFYYSDRLLVNNKNNNYIWSDGVRILQSIINLLGNIDGVFVPDVIVYTPFTQKFFDQLSGMYATVDITVESVLGLCGIDEMDEDTGEGPYIPDFPDLPDKPIDPLNPNFPDPIDPRP